jgi:hypothetical protein
VDTVEWGTAAPAQRPTPAAPQRLASGWLDRPVGAALAGLAVLALVVTQVVPWGTTQRVAGSDTSTVKVYIDTLPSIAVLAFYFGLPALLGLTGAALAARSAARRTLALAGIGVAAGIAVVLAAMIRALLSPTPDELLGQATGSGDLSLGLGPYAAVAALSLLTGSLVLSALPARGAWSARGAGLAAPQVPDWARLRRRPRSEAGVPEQPLDLTVTAVPPVNERLLGR